MDIMLHATVLKIKATDTLPEGRTWAPDNLSDTPLEMPKEHWEKVNTVKIQHRREAMRLMQRVTQHGFAKKHPERVGIALHPTPTLEQVRQCEVLRLNDDLSVRLRSFINPLWSGHKGVARNRATPVLSLDISSAMQSQLYSMLDAQRADSKIIQEFALKDAQQNKVYEWQAENLDRRQSMHPLEMANLMKKVLNYARLPWIELTFKETGKACFFQVQTDNGKILSEGGKQEGGEWDWLHKPQPDTHDYIGDVDRGFRVTISKLRLVMIMSWGLTPYFMLHELAHYIAFCMPLSYRLNKGEMHLSFNEYQDIFAGHGLFYMGVFCHLLTRFANLKADWLYGTLDEAGIEYIIFDDLSVHTIEKAITGHVKKNEK
jgi:hypothetical protein